MSSYSTIYVENIDALTSHELTEFCTVVIIRLSLVHPVIVQLRFHMDLIIYDVMAGFDLISF